MYIDPDAKYHINQLTGSTKTFSSRAVGTYAVALLPETTLMGIDSRNYVLDHDGSTPTIVTVTPLELNYSIGSLQLEYGSAVPLPEVRLLGVLGDDDVFSDGTVRVLDGDRPVDLNARVSVGQYVLDVLDQSLKGEAAANYTLADSGRLGTLSIRPKKITWSHGESSNVYGDALTISDYTLHGVFGDDDVVPTWEVVGGGGSAGPLQVGRDYTPWLTGLTGSDAGNYTYKGDGLNKAYGAGTLRVTPRPLQYRIDHASGTYGETGSYGSEFPIGDVTFYNLVEGDDVPQVRFGIYDESGTLIGETRRNFTSYYTPAGEYTVHLIEVEDPNYTFSSDWTHVGRTTIAPRELTYSVHLPYETAPFLTVHASNLPEATVRLDGVLDGDHVTLDAAAPDMPVVKTEGPAAGFYAVGTYTWRGGRQLGGSDAANYTIANDGNQDAALTIRPYVIDPVVDVTAVYGSLPEYTVKFAPGWGEPAVASFDAIIAALDVDLAQLVVDAPAYPDTSADRLPVGTYRMKIQDGRPTLIGDDAGNFEVIGFRGISYDVQPMPVIAHMISGTRTYGDADISDLFSVTSLDGTLYIDDDITVGYDTPAGFVYLDPRNPVGTYTGFSLVTLSGKDAKNYTLANPGVVEASVTVLPRRLFEWPDADLLDRTFGEYFDLTPELDYVVPGDEHLVWGEPMVRDSDGTVRSARELLDAGVYRYFVQLDGPAADNYILNDREWDARMRPKQITYTVADVLGQYGNYLGCLNPYSCYDDYWRPGLTTGEVHFDGLVPGHDDVTGVVGLIDFNGETGTLADVPPPGTYFQVITELQGKDGSNYTVAPSGSSPGILTIHPQWVKWEAHDALFMVETGYVVDTPEGIKTTLSPTLEYRPVEHPLLGITPLHPQLYYVNLYTGEVSTRVSLSRVAVYEYGVSHFEGLNADYYRPLPAPPSGPMDYGTLSVLYDSRMGMEMVDHVLDVPDIPDLIIEQPPTGDEQWLNRLADVYKENPLCSLGTCIEFGAGIEHSAQTSTHVGEMGISAEASAVGTALAQAGVHGVSLDLSASGQVDIQFEFGPGFVELTASAEAQFTARAGLSGIEVNAKLEAGATAETGVRGDLGGGAQGTLALTAGAGASLEAGSSYSIKNGQAVVENKYMASSGLSAGIHGEITGEVGGVNGGATVHGPGAAGGSMGAGVKYRDGKLAMDFSFGIALGFGGVELSLGFELDLGTIPGLMEAISFVETAGSGALCWTADVMCASGEPSIDEILETSWRGVQLAGDPVARFKYLFENPEWTLDDPNSEVYRANDAFFGAYSQMLRSVHVHIEKQQDMQEELFRLLEEDPAAAVNYAQNIARYTGGSGAYYDEIDDILSRMDRVGVRLRVVQGKAYFSGNPTANPDLFLPVGAAAGIANP